MIRGCLHACTENALALVFACTIPLFLGSCTASFYLIVKANEDIQYGEDSKPSLYLVLHKGGLGEWGLAVLDGAGTYSDPTIWNLPVLAWPEVESVDSFVVGPEDLNAIEQLIATDSQRGRSKALLYRMELVDLTDMPSQQEIAIQMSWGDNSYFYRYIVNTETDEIIPVAYGSFAKWQFGLATNIACLVTILAWGASIMVYGGTAIKRRLRTQQ